MFSRSSKLFLVCIMLITFSGVLQAMAAEQPILIMVERLGVGAGVGPEDIAVDAQGRIYGGMEDGRILRFQADGSQPELFADTGGRPLGLHFDAAGNLVVADGNKGLLSIAPRRLSYCLEC